MGTASCSDAGSVVYDTSESDQVELNLSRDLSGTLWDRLSDRVSHWRRNHLQTGATARTEYQQRWRIADSFRAQEFFCWPGVCPMHDILVGSWLGR
ncbi:MAG: hypothetical protein ACKVHU_21045 [Acidimicrobiales bacterium]